MIVSSRDFIHQQQIPPKYTSDGQNISPSLVIQSVPAGAQSLAVVMYSEGESSENLINQDKEVKIHWLLWNIQPDIGYLPEGTVPKGSTVGINDYWETGYGGPYPPAGERHKYRIVVYALDTMLSLPSGAGGSELIKAMDGHVLAKHSIVGYYQRK